ncbi:CBS domain-containing protein [Paenarthrobacter nitroguajacolicus]
MVKIPKKLPPTSTVGEVRSLFADDHVHMALVVAADGKLLTTIERADIAAEAPDTAPVVHLGRLEGRVALEWWSITWTTEWLKSQGRRRLAVVDAGGHLTGLLCLKRNGTGYCSDAGVLGRSRAQAEECVGEHPSWT